MGQQKEQAELHMIFLREKNLKDNGSYKSLISTIHPPNPGPPL